MKLFPIFIAFTLLSFGECVLDAKVSTIYTHYCTVDGSCFPVWRSNEHFYVFPQLEVISESLKIKNYSIIRRHQVSFQVKLYDICFLQAVAKHLTKMGHRQIDPAQVHILPLRDMRLVWANDNPTVDTIWLSTNSKPQIILKKTVASFYIFTQSTKAARELFQTINDNPGFLQEVFEIQYKESGTETKRARLLSRMEKNETCKNHIAEATRLPSLPSTHGRSEKMILIGGQSTNSTEIYTPNDTSQNKELSGLNITRKAAVAAFFDGKLYAAGGFHSYPLKHETSTEFYDFQENQWKMGPNMKYSHSWGSACMTHDHLFVCGGANQKNRISKNCEFLKSNSTAWKSMKPMPHYVMMHSCAVIDNILYIIGGAGGIDDDHISGKRVVQRYNRHNTWSLAASLSKPRVGAASAVLGNEIIVCGGGPSRNASIYYDDCEKYNKINGWIRMNARMNRPRVAFVLLACNNELYAFGGLNVHTPDQDKEVEVYKPEEDAWSFCDKSLIVGRSTFTGTVFH